MKRIMIGIVCLFIIFNFNAVNAVNESIIIGYYDNNSIIKKPHHAGYVGFGFEYFEQISKYSNHNYEFKEVTYKNALSEIENGNVHILGPVYSNEEKDYFYTKQIGEVELLLGTHDQNHKLVDNSIIYVKQDDNVLKLLNAYIEKLDISVTFNHQLDDYNKLSNEFIVFDNLQSGQSLYVIQRLGTVPYYFKALNQSIINNINDAIDFVYEDDYLFYDKLYLKYLQFSDINYCILKQEELQPLLDKVYKVGYSKSYVPVSYQDENGNPKGIAIDILNLISNRFNIQFEYVLLEENKDIQWDLNLSVLNDYIYPKTYLSSISYYDFTLFLVSNPSKITNNYPTYGLFDYNLYQRDIITKQYAFDNFKTYQTIDALANALYVGDIDYVVTTNLSTDLILKDPRVSNYHIEPLEHTLSLPLIFNENITSQEIISFKKIIESISSYDISKITTSNASNYELQTSLEGFVIQYAFAVFVVILLFVFLILSFIIYFLNHKQKTLKKQLNFDTLTGGNTKYNFIKKVSKAIKDDQYNNYIIISIKLDQYSYLSELHGYYLSIEIIKEYYKLIYDLFDNDVIIARVVEDEFVIFCHKNMLNEIDLNKLNYFSVLENEQAYYSSMGVYEIKHGLSDIQYMIDCATSARNKAVEVFGNSTRYFDDKNKEEREIKNRIISKMEYALKNKEFLLYFQPKINLKTNKVVGSEVLIRWHTNDEGIISPQYFIPLFEENHFIVDLDFYVLEEVFKLINNNDIPYKVAVNLSAYTIIEERFLNNISILITKYNIDINKIELEITESATIKHFNKIKARIKVLQAYGFYISIDDFGSGNSSLARFNDLDVNAIKIDRLFLNDITKNNKSYLILKSIIQLANQLDIDVIVEGVESMEQVKLLKLLDIHSVQGFYYSKAIVLNEFKEFLYDNEL